MGINFRKTEKLPMQQIWKGRKVAYISGTGVSKGLISSANDRYVFVKFHPIAWHMNLKDLRRYTAQACRLEDLISEREYERRFSFKR